MPADRILYVSNRRQSVIYNGRYFNLKKMQRDVTQGSYLGTLLFPLFILAQNCANTVIYAGDTTLYLPATSMEELSTALDVEMQLVVN